MQQPVCVECGASLGGNSNNNNKNNNLGISEHLYDAEEKILKQCPRCNSICDPFLETDQVVTGLNVALLRKSAWRHIIHNNLPNETYFLIGMFVLSIALETMVALCWKKAAMKMVHDDIITTADTNLSIASSSSSVNLDGGIGMKRLSGLLSSAASSNSTTGIVLSFAFSLASSAYSNLVLGDEFSASTSTTTPPLAFLKPYISTTIEALLPATTPTTLQLSNSSNPFYYSSPRTADANNHFISEVQHHKSNDGKIVLTKKSDKSKQKEKQKTSINTANIIGDEDREKVDLVTFVLTSPVMSPSALETMKMMSLLGFCALAETVLFLVAIVALMSSRTNISSSSSSSSNKHNRKTRQVVPVATTATSGGSSAVTVVVSRPLSATVFTRSVLVAQCARLAYLPFFIWSIPLDLIPLIEFTQILWYYLASGALTVEDDRIRRWTSVALTLLLRSMFRIVTQWAPIVGWF